MSLIIDLIVVVIILLFTFLGYKRGLIKLAIKLCTFVIAVIIAFMVYKPVANIIIQNTELDETIENAIVNTILPEGSSTDDEINLSNDLPNIIIENSQNTVISIAHSISTTLIETTCLLIIFIVVKIVLKFVTFIADLIAKLPILKQFNKLGGTIYGILEGLLIILVGFAVISLIAPLLDISILESINNSNIAFFFYNNNLLLKILM